MTREEWNKLMADNRIPAFAYFLGYTDETFSERFKDDRLEIPRHLLPWKG